MMSKLLTLTSPRLYKVRAENTRLRTKLNISIRVALGEAFDPSKFKDHEERLKNRNNKASKPLSPVGDAVGENKFVKWFNDMIDAIVKFFRNVFRSITAVRPKLERLLKKVKSMYEKYDKTTKKVDNQDSNIDIWIAKANEFNELDTSRRMQFNPSRNEQVRTVGLNYDTLLKDIKELGIRVNGVISQRLHDIRNGVKIEKVKDTSVYHRIRFLSGKLDKKITESKKNKKNGVRFNYYIGKLEDSSREYTRVSLEDLDDLFPYLQHDVEETTTLIERTQKNLDRQRDLKRILMRSINKNTVAENENWKDVRNEMTNLLVPYLKINQQAFGLYLKRVGHAMKSMGKLIQTLEKEIKKIYLKNV